MRYLSPTLFAAVFLFFALPFGAVVTCDDDEVYDWTGYELATRSVEERADPEVRSNEDIERWGPFALTILGAAAAGLLLGVFRQARGAGWVALGGLVATFALPFLITNIDVKVGYSLTLLDFALLSVLHAFFALRRRGRARTPGGPSPPPERG